MVSDSSTGPTIILDKRRGTNAVGVRAHNERLILSLVRRYGGLPKAEISKLTGLSAQTASVIVRALEADGLLLRMEPRRGNIGQPSVPLRLDPDGVFSLGLKVGRRSATLILMDFVGNIRRQMHWTYSCPAPADILAKLEHGVAKLTDGLTMSEKQRIVGLGVAIPYELWNWAEEVGAPKESLDAWRDFDLQTELNNKVTFPVVISNDGTAAGGAELIFGNPLGYLDFVYFFVGVFVGGGVVLDSSLYFGRRRNAGAFGSMPAPSPCASDVGIPTIKKSEQLIRSASLYRLERSLAAAGCDPGLIFKSPVQWPAMGQLLDDWIDEAAGGLAHSIVAAVSVIDFSAAIIDGWFPIDVRRRLVDRVREKVAEIDLRGLSPFDVIEGSVGANARVIGGASLPLFARFLLNRDVPFKDDV
jgi:predicted NBD/HSP70 family sugar kinase